MRDVETLRTRMYRQVTFIVIVALLMGTLAFISTVVAYRAIDAADSSRQRQFVRITALEHRIAILEDRGLAPKGN